MLHRPAWLGLLRNRELGLPVSHQPGPTQWLAVAEEDTLQSCHDTYLDWHPAPRSTIALGFSHDGELLASSQCVDRPA